MTDPYDILGVERDADEAQLKAAYRRLAKVAHPDSGGDSEAFANLQKAYGLLLDPVRRKVYDDTGYDVEFADAAELQALVMIEKLVTDAVLDERAPGSFDPVAVMQDSLSEELRKARFSKSELERHASRIGLHLERLEKQSGRDVLAHMFRARIEAISKAVAETEAKIKATERAADMLSGYVYDIDPPPLPDAAVTSIEWPETARNRSTG
ncbi:DnaJ domain-containing protein [Rhizobium leguminosarum bv. viciae]|uniref:DnaJ domain-containing protein n=1 Tax=Rhizobium leguminosarum bv. viciae TaxID=387 RepID=A0A8I2GPI2_RHILV|nr:J domain-containing protein [Rhizobium leguminosarum]MBY5635255.1 DnaJ domain-containing protein [Rhizobium leguminosarum]MBY5763343.1 DnaJ domain-containing protein [Rhizobium leguminosarum]MBY5790778.1 DnaJ domain-containing protein [Rhizobium leguminosarum]MBY5799021.1 DnaJ domain-containing protein [Rhizobium leguminosarum]NKM46174.1 DnaJ domain-containing protein [Rhizobium leguminosarum bv. viciae]